MKDGMLKAREQNTGSPRLPAALVNGVSVLQRLANDIVKIFGASKQFSAPASGLSASVSSLSVSVSSLSAPITN